MRALASAALALMAAAGCRSPAPAADARSSPRSTDAGLALTNLDAQIEGQESLLRRSPGALDGIAALIELLQVRARVLGRVSDLDRVEALGEQAVAAHPDDPQAWLARAAGRAALHRFDEAGADLERAARLGAPAPATGRLRASILQARGQLDEAVALRKSAVAAHADVTSLGALGGALALAGDAAGAEGAFDGAVSSYRDTSPFPLAWLDFQRGFAAERRGEMGAARARYLAVLARLPLDVQAAAHLASLEQAEGRRERAITLLRPLAARTEDPEPAGQLAALLDPQDAEAAGLRERARQGYLALLGRHPQAFADHAARFFLALEPQRALALSELNLAARPTAEAFDLALTAALAARDPAAGCRLAVASARLQAQPRRLKLLAEQARAGCDG